MAGKWKDIMEIKQLILLHSQKKSNRKIGKILGMSRNTVNTYVSLIKKIGKPVEELLTKTDEELSSLFGRMQVKDAKRFKDLTDYFPEVLTGSKQVGFTYYKMWEEYRIRHPAGFGYTQFLAHYHKWNSKTEATLKITHKAGECLLVDYAGDKLSWIDQQTGEVHDVDMFVGCLPASGFTFAECTPSQQKEDFISSMVNCLNYIGGSPQCIVVDNLKSAVSKSSKYEAVTNRTFRDMAHHYGSILNPARPYRPKDKAMVERMVDLLYEAIYFPLRNETFFSLHELNERVRELLDKFNDKKLSQLDCSRRALFLSIEHELLQPLPPEPYQIKHYKRAKVQKTAHVYLSTDKHYYSVPYRYIGKSTRIHFSDKVVEVYYNHQRIATHLRNRTASGYTTKQEHLPSQHQFYLDWSPAFFIEKAEKIGPNTTQYIKRLFDQDGHAEVKYKTAMGIIQLQRQYDHERIEKGCQLAFLHPITSYRRLVGILEKRLDEHAQLFESQNESVSHIPDHANTRGANYFSNN